VTSSWFFLSTLKLLQLTCVLCECLCSP